MSLISLLIVTGGVGLLLGLLGGGGSILMVPVLVYLMGLEAKAAIATSLIVIGLTSLVAVIGHARSAHVCWKNGWVFGLSGMAGAYTGGRLAAYVPDHVLLLMFAFFMFATAFSLFFGRRREVNHLPTMSLCPTRLNLPAVIFDGFLVGTVTGLVGVGGGFVIVPALTLLGGLPIKAAIGTSLLVITMNSAAALLGYSSHIQIDWHLAANVTLAAMVGSSIGSFLSHRLAQRGLRRLFSLLVVAIASYLLHRELSWQTLDEIRQLLIAHHEFFRGLFSAIIIMLLYWLRGVIHHRHQNRLAQERDKHAT